MPPKADQACRRKADWFGGLSDTAYGDFVHNGACVRCRWSVVDHPDEDDAAPAAAPAATDLYGGAAFAPSADPGTHFRETLSTLREGPFCSDDTDKVKKALVFLSAAMHDGTSSFIATTFRASGACDISRKFELIPDLPRDVVSVQTRARDIKAIDLLGHRFADGVLKPIARYRHIVLREDLPVSCERSGVSSEIKALDYLLTRRIVEVPGVVMPHAKHWTNTDQCTWIGLFVATCPSSELVGAASELVIALGKAFKAAHPEAFWDKATHTYKYAKLIAAEKAAAAVAAFREPSARPDSPKRQREGAGAGDSSPKGEKIARTDPRSPFMRFTKEERAAHGALMRAARQPGGGGASLSPGSTASLSSVPSTASLGGSAASGSISGAASTFSTGTGHSSHSTWRAPHAGGQGGRGSAGGSGGRGGAPTG